MGLLYDLGAVLLRYYNPCPAATYEAQECPKIYKPRQSIFCDFAGVVFDRDNYCFELEEEDRELQSELPGRYVVVQLRSHDKWRDYPYVPWLLQELVKLGKEIDFRVVTVDSTERYDVKDVISYSHLPLGDVFGVIDGCLLFIGPDSMGIHAAGALQKPSLGIFGPTNPRVRLRYYNAHWMPGFRRCKRQYCWYLPCRWKLCLRVLTARAVVRQARRIIEEAA